ncbi:MAG: HEPN domain-containing protein [Clostridia bacterium]|nr:HEPN domain-containing protein [Clostridia bacterium]
MSRERNESRATIVPDGTEQMDECRAWLAFAQTDYDCAEYLNKAPLHPRPLNVICYHCQQAAEKAIKALIVYFGSQGGVPKAHDLSFLLGQIRHIVFERKRIEISHDLMTMADSLSKYGVAPRYPNEMEVDEAQTAKALKSSGKIIAWVRQVIAAEPVQK